MSQKYLFCQNGVCFFGCDLLGVFQRKVTALGVAYAINENLDMVYFSMFFHLLVQKPEIKFFMVFLCPLKEFAFEVDIGLLEFIEVDVHLDDAVDDDVLCEVKATVKIDGPHEGLKGVSAQREETSAIVMALRTVFDVVVETELFRQLVE